MRNTKEFSARSRDLDRRFNLVSKAIAAWGCLLLAVGIAAVSGVIYVLFNPGLIGRYAGLIASGFQGGAS